MAAEEFIHFIWKHRFYRGTALKTSCGLDLEVVDPGEQNVHAGPDFFNARIRMGGMLWAGNVEIHRYSSDWYKHGHHLDPAYNNVILHVVNNHDSEVANSLGRRILTLLPDYPRQLLTRYQTLKKNEESLSYCSYINELDDDTLRQCLHLLHLERNRGKSSYISSLIAGASGNMEEAFFLALAAGYGLPVNGLPFELLARACGLKQLSRHIDNLFDLEALLLGHSGLLLGGRNKGPYPASLWDRYSDLAAHLPGAALPAHLWKFLRLRPSSFPSIRISQFASTLHLRQPLVNSILGVTDISEMEQVLRVPAGEYWTTHYLFGKASPPLTKYPGEQFVRTLIINVLIPFLTALEKREGRKTSLCRASELLSQLNVESNRIIKNWRSFGIIPRNAAESQALIQLFNVYCKQKRCLQCRIANSLMRAILHEEG